MSERKIRISCAGFVVLKDEYGRFCLLINKNQLDRHGKRVLTPIGGGIAAFPEGLKYFAASVQRASRRVMTFVSSCLRFPVGN